MIREAGQYLLFAAEGRRFALPLEAVREVVDPRPFARIPGAPAEVCGLVNLRGRVVTVLDCGLLLGLSAAAAEPLHRLVVVEHGGMQVGLAVAEVLRIGGGTETSAAAGEPSPAVEAEPYAAIDLDELLDRLLS